MFAINLWFIDNKTAAEVGVSSFQPYRGWAFERAGMNAQLILGASIYWSAVGFRYLGAFAGAGEAPGTRLSAVKYAVFVIVILSVYLTARKTGVLRARTIFSLAALVSSLFLVLRQCRAVG